MPFKLTGYCRLRSKDGKFKPRRRRMQNVWLYSAKWSHLNKDKRDCRTFQLIKQFVQQLQTLEKRAVIYNFILYSCDFHEGRQHFITLLMLVLNFAF